MTRNEAMILNLTEYVPNKACARGHFLRNTKWRYCIKCKVITDIAYKVEYREKNAKWQKDYRARQGDEYRAYIKTYMREYRKTAKHAEWRKKHYDEVIAPRTRSKSNEAKPSES
jgi:hypothetical protein